MKVAVIGSRSLIIDHLEWYLPPETQEIVSGGARGVDACAKKYAIDNGIKLTEFKPLYERYGRAAPIVRNFEIIEYVDIVLAFWDGQSRGTKRVIDTCRSQKKRIIVYNIE